MKPFDSNKQSDSSYVEWIAQNYGGSIAIDSSPSLPWHTDELQSGEAGLRARFRNKLSGRINNAISSTSSFYDYLSGGQSDPIGFVWKLISLTVIPLVYAMAGYLFFNLYLGWWDAVSRFMFVLILCLVLFQACRRLSPRPSFLDTLKFFLEEAGIVWVMWVVGSMVYTYTHHVLGLFSMGSTFLGLLCAVVAYLLSGRHIRRRPAAEQVLTYLSQIAWIAVTNVAALAVGFLITPLVSKQADTLYSNYIWAMLLDLVWFWISLNLFCVPSSTGGSRARLERGSALEIH